MPKPVDLEVDYSIVADNIAAAPANRAGIKQALLDHPANMRFQLPVGTVYVDRGTDSNGIRIVGPMHDIVLAGWGRGVTTIAMTGDQQGHASSVIMVADGAARVTLCDFTIRQDDTMTNVSGTQMNQLIQIDATNADVLDIEAYNISFQQAVGDAFRINGSPEYTCRQIRLHHFSMRMAGHPLAPKGARSGVSFQRGYDDVEIAHFFITGVKNTSIDMEPSVSQPSRPPMYHFNIHDGVVDNSSGLTQAAVSLAGTAAQSAKWSRLHAVTILEGVLQIINTERVTVSDCLIHCSGRGPMAGAYDALVLVKASGDGVNTDTTLRGLDLIRDIGSAGGPLVATEADSIGLQIEGGNWFSAVSTEPTPASGNADKFGMFVKLNNTDKFRMDGTRIRLTGADPKDYGIRMTTPGSEVTNAMFANIQIEAEAKLQVGIHVKVQKYFSNISIVNVQAPGSVAIGVQYESGHNVTIEPYPIVQGCNFDGAIHDWLAISGAENKVFPVIAGSKNGRGTLVGTVPPEGVVIAVQGVRYVWQNGDASREFFKHSGTGETGWTEIALMMVGTVHPQNVVTAMQGVHYVWQNGNASREFVKHSGTGNTGWLEIVFP